MNEFLNFIESIRDGKSNDIINAVTEGYGKLFDLSIFSVPMDVSQTPVVEKKAKFISIMEASEYEVPRMKSKSNKKLKTYIPPSKRTMKNLPRLKNGDAKVRFQDWLEMDPLEFSYGKGSDGKHYGWSHRAVYGFGIGDKVKKGDCAYNGKEYTIKTEKEAEKAAKDFAESVS